MEFYIRNRHKLDRISSIVQFVLVLHVRSSRLRECLDILKHVQEVVVACCDDLLGVTFELMVFGMQQGRCGMRVRDETDVKYKGESIDLRIAESPQSLRVWW